MNTIVRITVVLVENNLTKCDTVLKCRIYRLNDLVLTVLSALLSFNGRSRSSQREPTDLREVI